MGSKKNIRKAISSLLFCIYTVELLASPLVVDPNTRHNTSLDHSATGVPIVNIATPNGRGVSVNEFLEYNIGEEGQVLNNADNVGRSHLAGLINSNPNLGPHQAANLVVLQVNGANRSQIEGYLEALSREKINVLLSNENGIYINGGGTIGIQRFTASTGKPQIQEGDLLGIDVSRGMVSIGPKGLDISRTEYVTLLAKSLELQGNIVAKDQLEVLAGENKIQAGKLERKEGKSTKVAIDASSLGGMYANQIKIISTDQGAGVNSDAFIVSKNKTLEITADGKVQLRKIQGKGIQIEAKEYLQTELANSEEGISIEASKITLEGKGTQAKEDVVLQGKVENKADLYTEGTLLSKDLTNHGNIQVDKAVKIEGTLDNTGNLQANDSIQVSMHTKNTGSIKTQGAFSAQDTQNSKQLLAKENIQVKHLQNTGFLGSQESVKVEGVLDNAGELKAMGDIHVALQANNTGEMVTNGSFVAQDTMTTKTLVASKGVKVHQLKNAGLLATEGELLVEGALDNAGNIQVKQDIHVRENIKNEGEILSSTSLRAKDIKSTKELIAKENIQSHSIQNTGFLGAGQRLDVQGSLENANTIEAKEIAVQGALLSNQGNIKADGIKAKVESVSNAGEILSFQDMSLESKEIKNQKKIGALGSIYANGTKLINEGEFLSNQEIQLNQAELNNRNKIASNNILMKEMKGFQNTGTIHGNHVALETTGDLLLEGALHGEESLLVRGKKIQNQGQTTGKGLLSFHAETFQNLADLSGKEIEIVAKESIENQKMLSADSIKLQATQVVNQDLIAGSYDVNIAASKRLENQEGKTIYAGKHLGIQAEKIQNQGELFADTIRLEAEHVRNEVGTIQANQNVEILAPKFENIGKVEDLEKYEYYYVTWDGRVLEEKDIPGWKLYLGDDDSTRSKGNGGRKMRQRQREEFQNILAGMQRNPYASLIFPKYTEELRGALGNSGEYTKQTGSAEIPELALIGKVRSKGKTTHGKVVAGNNISIQSKEVLNQDSMISAGGKVEIAADTIENRVTTGEKLKVKDGREKAIIKFGRRGSRLKRKVYMEASYTRDFAPDTIRKRVRALDKDGKPVVGRNGRKRYRYVEEYIGRYAYVTGQPSVIEGKEVILDSSKLVKQSIAEANGIVKEDSSVEHKGISRTVKTGTSKDKEELALSAPTLDTIIPGLEANRGLEIASNTEKIEEVVSSGKIELLPSLPSSLFVKNLDPSSKYIMETRSPHVRLGAYYGSEYFLEKVGYVEKWDRVKRLGDAFYENQLLERSIAETLGSRFLQGKQVSMKELIENAAEEAKKQNLLVGTALTEAQRKQLTQDIVWYENTSIDGVPVLVPKIYLSKTSLDRIRLGGNNQIAGTEGTFVKTGTLTNTGVIGTEGLTYIEADKVENRSLGNQRASIQGDKVSLLSKGDIQNLGGQIQGSQEVQLISQEGDIVNRSTLSKTEYEYHDLDRTRHTAIDSIASISTEGKVTIQGKNYNSVAALTHAKEANIQAEEVNIGAQKLEGAQKFGGDGSNFQSYAVEKEIGSQVEVEHLQVKAKNMNIEGSAVLAKDAKLAVDHLNIDSTITKEDRLQVSKDKGLLKTVSKTKKEHNETNVAGVLAVEGKAEITGDVQVQGSTLALGKDSVIEGKVHTDSKVTHNQYFTEEKKKGFSSNFSASGFSISYGKSKVSYEEKDKTNSKSNLVLGDGTVLKQGANINATNFQHGKIRIQGGDVIYGARKDEKDITTSSKSSGFGISFHISSPALERAKQARDAAKQLGDGDALGGLVNIGNVAAGTVAGLAGNQGNAQAANGGKARDKGEIKNAKANNDFYLGAKASIGYNRSKQESKSHQESAVVSHITGMDKDASITYDNTKNVIYEGTKAKDTSFVYNGVERIEKKAVQLENTSSSKGSASGIGISAGMSFSPSLNKGTQGGNPGYGGNDISVSLNVSASKNKQNTEETIYQNGSFQNVNEEHNNTGTMILSGFNQAGGKVTGNIQKVELESLQNTSKTTGSSKGANIGIPLTGGIPTGNISYAKTEGERTFVDKQSSFVVGKGSELKIGEVSNTAAILGTEGNGSIQIDQYTGKNLENHEDLTTKGGSIGTGGVGIQYSDTEKEGITRNTVIGNVEIASASGETINTDLGKANEITEDSSTSTNVYVEKQLIDAVAKPKDFQDKMEKAKQELKDMESVVKDSIKNKGEDDRSFLDLLDSKRRSTTINNLLGKDLAVILEKENAKEIKEDFANLMRDFGKDLGIDLKVEYANTKTLPEESQGSVGSAYVDSEKKQMTIFINTDEVRSTATLVGTVMEEFSHVLDATAGRQDMEVAGDSSNLEKGLESLGRPVNEYFQEKYSKKDKEIQLEPSAKDFSKVDVGTHVGDVAPIALYLGALVSAPDFQLDLMSLTDSGSEFLVNPNLGTGTLFVLDIIGTAVPGLSSTVLKQGGKVIMKGGKMFFLRIDGALYKVAGKGVTEFIEKATKTKAVKVGMSAADDIVKFTKKTLIKMDAKAGESLEIFVANFKPKNATEVFEFAGEHTMKTSGSIGAKNARLYAIELPVPKSLQSHIDDIVKRGDISGGKTETLVNEILSLDKNLELLPGKYGSNNGFDHVVRNKTTGEIWILDSKQFATKQMIETGSTQLAVGAGEKLQLSPKWIEKVSENVGDSNLKKILKEAKSSEKLKTAVIGINKKDGKLMVIPVLAEDLKKIK